MSKTSAPGIAALSILAGMMTLGLTDNFLAFITDQSSLWQFHLIRGGLALAAIGVVAALGWGVLWPKRPVAVLARSVLQAGAMLIYFGCLAVLPISVVVAGLFTSPLFVLLIAVMFQGKRVGAVRIIAIIAGFTGALMVIRPDPAALDPVAFLPILAGLLYAIGAVATRAWCEGEGTLCLSAGFFALLSLMGGVGCLMLPGTGTGADGFALRGWTHMTGTTFAWIALQAIGAVIGIALIFRGYQRAEASFVAVFEYSLLVFASAWAFVLWGDRVPMLGLLGMALIAAAGTTIALRPDR